MPAAAYTLTLRLDARQRAAVRRLAAREGVSEEEAVLRAVEQADEGHSAPVPGSLLEAFGDAVGSFSGPPDLSTNKAYLEGLGEPTAPRGREGRP